MRAGDFIERIHFQRQIHAALAANKIDHHRDTASLSGVRNSSAGPPAFTAVGDLRDFEHRIDFGGDALQLAFFFQLAQESPADRGTPLPLL